MKGLYEEIMAGQKRESAALRLFIGISISLHIAALGTLSNYKGLEEKLKPVIEIITVDMQEPPTPPVVSARTAEVVRISHPKPIAEQKVIIPPEQPSPPPKAVSQPVNESVPLLANTMTITPKQTAPRSSISPLSEAAPVKPHTEVRHPVMAATQNEQKIGQEREYGRIIRGVIEKHKEYPLIARKSGIEGVVIVKFVLSCEGELKSAELHRSCGRGILDSAALKTVSGIKRFPSHPDKNRRADISFELPIAYKISPER